jgi:hyperosmotically inducible periplasmic protein
MTKTLAVTYLAVAGLLGSAAVTAAEPVASAPSTGTYVKDSAITAKVKTELAAQHANSLANISVDTDKDGVVWLSGTARTQEAIDLAVKTTKATDGVRSVHSTVTVQKAD